MIKARSRGTDPVR